MRLGRSRSAAAGQFGGIRASKRGRIVRSAPRVNELDGTASLRRCRPFNAGHSTPHPPLSCPRNRCLRAATAHAGPAKLVRNSRWFRPRILGVCVTAASGERTERLTPGAVAASRTATGDRWASKRSDEISYGCSPGTCLARRRSAFETSSAICCTATYSQCGCEPPSISTTRRSRARTDRRG
jgi:hypothetical protein